MSNVSSITYPDLLDIIKSKENCLVDIWAEWCSPCKMILPILEELSIKYDNIKFYKISVNEDIAARFSIKSVPTVLLIKHGEVVDKIVGARDIVYYEQKMKEVLGGEVSGRMDTNRQY